MLGEDIKKLRQEKGLTQQELAELANVSLSTIQRIERGENVGIYYIQQVLAVLKSID